MVFVPVRKLAVETQVLDEDPKRYRPIIVEFLQNSKPVVHEGPAVSTYNEAHAIGDRWAEYANRGEMPPEDLLM